MKYFFYSLVFFLINSYSLNAQTFQGFSKLYKYSGDTLLRNETISAITCDTTNQALFFCTSGILGVTGTFFVTFTKTDLQGNVIKETIDSLNNGSVGYFSVAESKDHQYLYWGGNSFVYGDTASIHWKVRKTDKDLNVIWDKYYPRSAATNSSYNIKALDSGQMLLLCFDYTHTNNLGLPVKPSTIFLRKIDGAGNIIEDHAPVNWPYTDAYGLDFTNDGGYMINGQSNSNGYVLKTDGNYIEQWHQYYGTDVDVLWLLGMCKQNGAEEMYFNAGEITTDANYDGIGFASKTDGNGAEVWQKRILKNGTADGFFGVCNGRNLSTVFAGATYYPEIQTARGWMVKLDNAGNEIWNKLYSPPHPDGYHDYLYKVLPMPDGGFLAAGSTFGQEANGRWSQYGWLLRVDSNGCYNSECSSFTAITTVKAPKETIDVFPNPSSGMVHLIKSTPFPKNTTVTLIDATGKTLKELESPSGKTQMVYNLKGALLPGVYFLKIDMGNEVLQKKVVITF